ncbi:hypothetical protein MA16_Dca000567 [Dendrobium catenatum]|uniref:Uncharacterized protein n=1 Tax=Dendrobium catenatum TaxID=906689 RepID=A0A2I0WUA6_9ASPA|nr:hypothetical protein MA16_Dca000567 [Dendrobium catenatum]
MKSVTRPGRVIFSDSIFIPPVNIFTTSDIEGCNLHASWVHRRPTIKNLHASLVFTSPASEESIILSIVPRS